jgi:pimeloyl-ACP methyl ester carboxylesterase
MGFFFLGLFMALPYLFPVNQATLNPNHLPYNNSYLDTINGISLHYRVFNPTDSIKGNIFLVHGFSASTFCWRNNYDTLIRNGFRVVAVDVPAFGYSDKRTHFNNSTTERSKAFYKLINKIDSEHKWNLMGHSMGGGIVCTMAAMFPNKTQSLIMVDGVGGNIKKSKRNILVSALLCNRFMYRISEAVLHNYFLKPKQFKKLLSSAYSGEASENAVSGYMDPFRLKNSAAAIFSMSGNSFETEEVNIEKINSPILLFWGTKDTWLPKSQGDNFKKRFPQTKYIQLENAGHCGMETQSGVFNSYLISFLNSNGYFH